MTTTEPEGLADVVDLDLDHLSATERAERARQAWRASGGGLSAGQLAERFDRSERWGRQQIAAARQQDAAAADDSPPKGVHETDPPAARQGPAAAELPPALPRQDRTAAPAAVELPPERWYERWGWTAGRMAVLAAAAALSYSHMRQLVIDAGGAPWQANVWPASVDGLAAVALVALQQARRAGERATGAWVALLAALTTSVAANVASAEPTLLGRLVAGWPPLALAVVEALGHRKEGRQ